MKHLLLTVGAALMSAQALHAQATRTAPDLNTDPPQPQSTACGDIIRANINDEYEWFPASDVIECLKSVPFHPAVASRFVAFYNQTLQFQSTTAFLRSPPQGYRQPSCDIAAKLQAIQDNIRSGYYRNQLAFDIDIQEISHCTHDTHAGLYAGVLSQFTFAAQFYIASVSSDGKQLPDVYSWDDVADYASNTYNASPIASIDDIPIVEYLENFAAHQSFGLVEPEADWNALMFSPAQYVVGGANVFSGGATFYPGDEMTIKWQNESVKTMEWAALYNSPGFTGPLETGGDFYNFFVLNIPPANWETEWTKYDNQPGEQNDEPPTQDETPSVITSWHKIAEAYPADTMTYEDELGIGSNGFITSYYLEDISTAVLSIPSFIEYDEGIGLFSQAIIDFIGNATENSAKKVIIDLQQNSGGQVALAFEVFRQFFPDIAQPEPNSRMRIHPLADVLGSTMSSYFQSLGQDAVNYTTMVSEEWVVTDRINVETHRNFTSWEQFRGPKTYNDDTFSLPQSYNLSDPVFVQQALDVIFPDCYYAGTGCNSTAHWAGRDITLLTDGTCGSTCALFVEMMTQSANVSTTVVGGPRRNGPMQAASGSRGAVAYSSDNIDVDFKTAQGINERSSDNYIRETGMYISYAGVNLRDQLRNNSQGVPTQFLYQPADCRIFWTLANVNNYSILWRDVWNATWNDTSLCVPGSTNVKTPSVASPRKRSTGDSASSLVKYIMEGISRAESATGQPDNDFFGVLDSFEAEPSSVVLCPKGPQDCILAGLPGAECRPWTAKCTAPGVTQQNVCLYKDKNTGGAASKCGGFYYFRPQASTSGSAQSSYYNPEKKDLKIGVRVQAGWCMPSTGNGIQSCTSVWGRR